MMQSARVGAEVLEGGKVLLILVIRGMRGLKTRVVAEVAIDETLLLNSLSCPSQKFRDVSRPTHCNRAFIAVATALALDSL